MKKTLFTLLSLLLVGSVFAQRAPQTKLISSSEEQIVVNFQLNGFGTSKVATPQGEQFIVSVPKMASMLEAGAPDLPLFPIPAIIGDEAEMTVNVIDAQYTDYQMAIAPSKGNLSRQVNPEDVPYVYGDMYQENAFWPATQAYLENPYIMRDFRGQNIMVRPFAYNPVTETLRVYTNMTIAMTKVSDNGANKKAARKSSTIKVDPEQKAQYGRRFINFTEAGTRYTFDEDFGEMLVICADMYMSNVQPLVDWKNQSGRPTTMVSLSEVGGNNIENIKTYVSNFYNDPDHNLEYVLLVGEYNDITPKNMGSGSGGTCYSDNYIGKLEGNDNYLEVLVGRLSVNSTDDADLQVNKVIFFERDVTANDAWAANGLGIGAIGAGSGHYGEDDYQHIDLIRDTLLHYTYNSVNDLHGGGGASISSISAAINQGISIINYCNHGSETSWGVANYSNSNVLALTNDNMLPIVWSVACLNGKFDVGTCFAEAWLRAKNNATNAPTGAVGGMFSFVSQPWQPPMYGQDEMVDVLTEWRSADQFHHSFGGASLNGSMYVLDMAPGDSYQTFNTWLLFGDPSMMMRTAVPTEMNVTPAPSVLMLGMNELSITADADYAIATLSMNGEIIASGEIVNGEGTLTFPALNNVGMADLVVLGYNKVTYMGTIEIVPAEGAYISVNAYELNQPANYGETVNMNLEIKNVGVETADNITVTLSTDNEYINLIVAEGTVASLEAGQTAMIEGFQFEVATNAPDGMKAQVDATMTDGTDVWTGKVTVELHAPVIELQSMLIADTIVEFSFANNGSAPFNGGTLMITSCSPDLTFDPETITSEEIIEGGAALNFNTTFAFGPDVEPGTTFEAAYEFTSGDFNISNVFTVSYGAIMEDFEGGVFGNNWTFSQNGAWTIVDGGTKGSKCAKSTNEGISNSDYRMTLSVDVLAAGELTFMYKVSSEANWDKFHFYMDNQEKGVWSGTVEWTQFTQPVTVGQHTFTWSYTKDSSVNSGSDCVWVDDIIFPPTNVLTFLTPASDLEAEIDGANVTLRWMASTEADNYVVKRDGEVIATVTETTLEDVLPKDGTYTYAVYAATESGQLSVPVTTTVTAIFDEVVENANANLSVYPNPANDVLNIVIDANNFKYQLVNSLGQVVREGNACNKTVIKTGDLNKGVYFLQISTGAKVMVEKVVVE